MKLAYVTKKKKFNAIFVKKYYPTILIKNIKLLVAK
jgi:hypothetical protein